MTTTNEQEHHMSTDETTAPEAAEAPETPDEAPEALDPAEGAEEPGEGAEGPDVAKLRKEAAGHRRRLREVEAERDSVTTQRDALADVVLGDALRGTGLTPKAFSAAGRTVEEFISADGLDADGLRSAARDVAREFGIVTGRSPHTGTGTERPAEKSSWQKIVSGE